MSSRPTRSDRAIPLRRTWGQWAVLTLNVTLIAICLSVAGLLGYARDRASAINRVALDRSLTEVAQVESGSRVLNILLVGSDSSATLDADDPVQIGRQGEHFGDVIIIAHLDERTGSVAMLSLPRDLWVPIADADREDRINRAFLVGGPATLIDTIEENFGIPIHHYVNVDFAGFRGLVEAVGSVDVHFDTAARDWNVNAEPEPRSQTGFLVDEPGCHSLDPEQALAYVRSRYYQTRADDGEWVTDPTSDLGRIRRQQDFLQRLLQEAIERGARNPLVLSDLIDTTIENVAIDQELTPALLVDLSATFRSFEPGDLQTYTYPVVDGTVGVNRVLLPRHDQAEAIRQLFAGDSFDAPSTVDVTVVVDHDVADDPRHLEVADRLVFAGFDIATLTPDEVEPGVWIRHGPDGAQAAAVVSAALLDAGAPAAATVETPGLPGRDVIVAVGHLGGSNGDSDAGADQVVAQEVANSAATVPPGGTPEALAALEATPASPVGPTKPAPVGDDAVCR